MLAASPKDVLNSTVFRCCQKATREFQARAATTGNAQSPRVRRPVSTCQQIAGDCRNCRRLQELQATAGTAARCQLQGFGEVSWRCTTKASESQNTEVKLYHLWNSQPMHWLRVHHRHLLLPLPLPLPLLLPLLLQLLLVINSDYVLHSAEYLNPD